jgi:DNA-binding XRE family transcriptional regulator
MPRKHFLDIYAHSNRSGASTIASSPITRGERSKSLCGLYSSRVESCWTGCELAERSGALRCLGSSRSFCRGCSVGTLYCPLKAQAQVEYTKPRGYRAPFGCGDTFQEEMADYLGNSQGHLSKIERGKGVPTIETLLLLSERSRKSIDWILRGEGN